MRFAHRDKKFRSGFFIFCSFCDFKHSFPADNIITVPSKISLLGKKLILDFNCSWSFSPWKRHKQEKTAGVFAQNVGSKEAKSWLRIKRKSWAHSEWWVWNERRYEKPPAISSFSHRMVGWRTFEQWARSWWDRLFASHTALRSWYFSDGNGCAKSKTSCKWSADKYCQQEYTSWLRHKL